MTDIQTQPAIQTPLREYKLPQRFQTADAEQHKQTFITVSAQGVFGPIESLISDAAALRTESSAQALRAAAGWRNLGRELMPYEDVRGFDDE